MSIRYTDTALDDIREILDYTASNSPAGASALSAAIEATVAFCSEQPERGTPVKPRGAFRYPMTAFRVTIFYKHVPEEDLIEVLRVIRSSRVKNLRRVPKG